MTRTTTTAAILLVGLAVVAWGLPAVGPSAVVIGYAALFLPYAAILWLLRDEAPAGVGVLLMGTAILGRFILVPADPLLSDDLYRYVWEGRVTLSGANPFVLAPVSDALTPLRDATIWPLINHPEIPTIYPPFSQGFFALNAALGGGLVTMKFLFVAFEAAMVAIVWRLVRDRVARRKLLFAFAIYALNPLVVVEVAWSGHLDVLAWGSLVAGLVVWESDPELRWRTVVLAATLVGLSISAKLLGVLALPFLVTGRHRLSTETTRFRRLGRRLAAPVLAVLVVVATYLPFADAGPKLFSGFGTYASTWRSNEGGYRAMASLTQHLLVTFASDDDRTVPGDPESDVVFRMESWDAFFTARGWTKTWEGEEIPATTFTAYTVAQTATKAIVAFLCALALLWLMLARWQPLAATASILLLLYFFAPTVHPWYVAWLVPFAALRPRATPIAFSALVLVGYGAWISMARGGPWALEWWAVALEYGIVAAVFLLPNKPPEIVDQMDTFPS